MSLANVLIRPRLLDRFAADELRVGDVVIELAGRLAADAAQKGSAVEKIGRAADAAHQKLHQEVVPRVRQAVPKVQAWFQPIEAGVVAGFSSVGNPKDAESALQSIASLLDWLADTFDKISADAIAQHIRALVLIIEDDFGFTFERFGQLLQEASDAVIQELCADYLAGQRSEDAKKDFVIGSHLAWLRRLFQEEIPIDLAALRLRDLGDWLAIELPRTGWDDLRARLATLFRDLATVCKGFSGQFSFDVSTNKGAMSRRGDTTPRALESPEISWYATWLAEQAETLKRSVEPEDWEKALGLLGVVQEYVQVADRFKPQDEPFAQQVANDGVPFQFLEVYTWAADFLLDFLDVVFNIVDFKEGSKVVNGIEIGLKGAKGAYTALGFIPEGEGWVRGKQVFDAVDFTWDKTKFIWESLEGEGTGLKWAKIAKYFAGFQFATPDADGREIFKTWMEEGARDLVLSVLTLSNARQNTSNESVLHQATEGTVALSRFIGHWLGAWASSWDFPPFGGKRHYGFPEHDALHIVRFFGINVLFCSFGFSLMFQYPGYWLAFALSGKDNTEDFGKVVTDTFIEYLPFRLFPPFYLFWWDGDTDGGKWGTNLSREVIPISKGYPPADTSPYELPFEKKADKWVECLQGHHGFWSHNAWTGKLYAADFGMDYGEAVLAMRGGTVVDYQDHWPDSSYSGWNYIIIRHDDPTEAATPDPAHDFAPDGALTITYATYGHARHFGVRHAFQTRGIRPEQIIGTAIQKGQVLMYAGDTGSDALSVQVHVHVAASAETNAPSIPFVFKNLPGEGFIRKAAAGVPKTGAYYTSNNELKAAAPAHAIYQPDRQKGQIVRSGAEDDGRKYVVLDRFSNDREKDYTGAHLFISFERKGQTYFSYKKIEKYDCGDHKAYIVGDWDISEPPPPGSAYEIGGKPLETEDNFGKQFGYVEPTYTLAANGSN